MPLRIGEIKRKTVRYRWPEKGDIPEEDRAVFVLREPSPLQYRALTDRFVQYDLQNRNANVRMHISNTQISFELILMCLVDVENVEYQGKPLEITEENKRNKLSWLLDTNLGLDPSKYGYLIDDLVAFINKNLVPTRGEEAVEVEIGTPQGN